MKICLKKFMYIAGLLLFLAFDSMSVLAQTGPQGTIGPVESTGPQGQTGPLGSTGNNAEVGPQGPTGPQKDSQTNSITGANSENVNEISNSNDTDIQTNNEQSIDNNAQIDANTGKNDVVSNSSVGNVSTGNVDGTVNIINLGRSILSPDSSIGSDTLDGKSAGEIILPASTAGSRVKIPADLSNSLTGSNSFNTNQIDNQNIVAFVNDSDSIYDNGINIIADTGNNNIEQNTLVGTIKTGNVNMGINLINLQNFLDPSTTLSLDLWSINNGLNGDLIIPDLTNSTTGPNANNINSLNQDNVTSIVDTNINNISNTFDYNLNTGENNLASNSFVGNVDTGESKASGSVLNIIEQPVFYIINVFGKWLGKVIGLEGANYVVNDMSGSYQSNVGYNSDQVAFVGAENNSITGANSENTNSINNDNVTNIESDSTNSINNKIKIAANTGKNNISKNTVVDNIKTGSINVISNVANIISGLSHRFGKIKIGVINIYGDWNGNLANSPLQKDITISSIADIPATQNKTIINTKPQVQTISQKQVSVLDNNQLVQTNTMPNLDSSNIINENGLPSIINATHENQNTGNKFPFKLLTIPAGFASLWLILEILLKKLTK